MSAEEETEEWLAVDRIRKLEYDMEVARALIVRLCFEVGMDRTTFDEIVDNVEIDDE